MVNRKRVVAVVALVLLLAGGAGLAAQALPASTLKEPSWLLLELGKRAFRERNFGQALDYFRTSIARGGTTPEAQMWIGRVFEEEGEIGLAQDQYERALADASQLEIPAEATAILYDLARIYDNTNQYGKYEVTLKRIVAEDSEYSDPKEAFTRQSMVRILKNDGLDKLLVLYRLHEREALEAHSELGELFYRTGRYSDAITNLTFSTITILTVAIDAFKAKDPVYDFSTIDNLLSMAANDSRVSAYLTASHLFRDLYYLAASLYADGSQARAVAVWRVVTRWSPQDQWYRRSVAQLQKPYVEPILTISGQ